MTGNLVTVLKEGSLTNIDEEDLYQGDVVVLQTADVVPADLELIEASGLEVDEFDITGEIPPVVKRVGDEAVRLYAGSKVIRGIGKGMVIAVGAETEHGRVLNQSWEQNSGHDWHNIQNKHLGLLLLLIPPFLVQVAQSRDLVGAMFLYVILSVLVILLQNGEMFGHFIILSELKKLQGFNIQVRKREVIQQIGQMDILCFDKTGVLTTRQFEVKYIYVGDRLFQADDLSTGAEEPSRWINLACALSNDILIFEKLELANPIDRALISFALKNGIDLKELLLQHKRIFDKPFDAENRYMAAGFLINGKKYYFAKGDPGVVLRMCKRYMSVRGEVKRIDYRFWESHLSNMQAINESGDSAIALAFASDNSGAGPVEYTWLGLVQLENPLRPGARETITGIAERDIRTTLLTGDRAETAISVAMACGITDSATIVLTGNSLRKMEPREIARQSAYCSVFARLIPSQKGLIVRLLQEKGHCVGFVGDGVNDGIALRVADIGISFTKESSPIARRFSDILIKDLADLLSLIESANRVKQRVRNVGLFRTLALSALFLGIYGYVFVFQDLLH